MSWSGKKKGDERDLTNWYTGTRHNLPTTEEKKNSDPFGAGKEEQKIKNKRGPRPSDVFKIWES